MRECVCERERAKQRGRESEKERVREVVVALPEDQTG